MYQSSSPRKSQRQSLSKNPPKQWNYASEKSSKKTNQMTLMIMNNPIQKVWWRTDEEFSSVVSRVVSAVRGEWVLDGVQRTLPRRSWLSEAKWWSFPPRGAKWCVCASFARAISRSFPVDGPGSNAGPIWVRHTCGVYMGHCRSWPEWEAREKRRFHSQQGSKHSWPTWGNRFWGFRWMTHFSGIAFLFWFWMAAPSTFAPLLCQRVQGRGVNTLACCVTNRNGVFLDGRERSLHRGAEIGSYFGAMPLFGGKRQ